MLDSGRHRALVRGARYRPITGPAHTEALCPESEMGPDSCPCWCSSANSWCSNFISPDPPMIISTMKSGSFSATLKSTKLHLTAFLSERNQFLYCGIFKSRKVQRRIDRESLNLSTQTPSIRRFRISMAFICFSMHVY